MQVFSLDFIYVNAYLNYKSVFFGNFIRFVVLEMVIILVFPFPISYGWIRLSSTKLFVPPTIVFQFLIQRSYAYFFLHYFV